MCSSLAEPDMFGANSENSINDLYQLLSTDLNNNVIQSMMKELSDELQNQEIIETVGKYTFIYHLIDNKC
jgi:hypothetical protein